MLTTIVPNFNHARFLPEALGSLIEQTRPTDELIVIDDGSTDGSLEVISSFLARHPNARMVRNARNQGCNASMNDGLRLARGDFVHFAAADDLFDRNLYRTAITMLEAERQAAFFSARSEVIDEFGHKLQEATPRPGYPLAEPGFISPPAAARHLLRDDSWFMGNTVIYRAALLREQGGFPEELYSFADGFMCRLLALACGACFAPAVLGSWRRVDGGMAASLSADLGAASSYIAAGEARMLASGNAFPASYVHRWKGRQQFAIRRQALRQNAGRKRASLMSSPLQLIREYACTMWLALRWRPWDLGYLIRQRISHFAD